jgi:hypothetical protein
MAFIFIDYKEYASAHYSGLWTAPALALMSSAMVRAYCHKVIKLSDALQTYAPEKEETSNVHGVRDDFLKEGRRRASTYANDTMALDEVPSETTVYFIGKLLWTKGLDILLELEDDYKQYTGQYFSIDVYGSGPDQKDIMRAYLGRRKRSSEPESKEENVVLETTVSVADDLPASVVDELEDVSVTNVASTESATTEAIASLEALQIKAKEKLSQFKKTINAVEIPKSLHELRRQPIPATFPGRVDHAILTEQYKVFVNPSVSEGTFLYSSRWLSYVDCPRLHNCSRVLATLYSSLYDNSRSVGNGKICYYSRTSIQYFLSALSKLLRLSQSFRVCRQSPLGVDTRARPTQPRACDHIFLGSSD